MTEVAPTDNVATSENAPATTAAAENGAQGEQQQPPVIGYTFFVEIWK